MVEIPDINNKIPMMFRAQTAGRCQLQRIDTERTRNKEKQDVELWASEWIEKSYPEAPQFGKGVQTRTYQINWRFVTNAGQDDGIIRPVIGAYGWPYYPGSSMKGIFKTACTDEQKRRFCGEKIINKHGGEDWKPGILRFHGGYPSGEFWRENLVDIVHPQQPWQVGIEDNKSGGAFALISLYQPELIFGISADKPVDWDEVWQIWETALSKGIGCRVSTGYGQFNKTSEKPLYSARLKGQGMAPKLLNGEGEFRPNMFRGAIRGHALRIFGGLTGPTQAINLVETLFGGIQGDGTVGLLAMSFEENSLTLDTFGRGSYEVPTYNIEGKLNWFLTQSLPEHQQKALTNLIKALTQFAMVFGGFGKSWRRADHRLFYPDYYQQSDRKALIGCHWQWTGKRSLITDVKVRKIDKVGGFIDDVRRVAMDWMELQGVAPTPEDFCLSWREAWHPDNVQVWGRLADEAEDSRAVGWFHGPYRRGDRQFRITEGTIYESHLTGKVSQVGRVWHRMYPVVVLKKAPNNPQKPLPKNTPQFLEFFIFFPDNSQDSDEFLHFLNSEQKLFKKLWPQTSD
jgi:CRISPR-associated protein Cmr6